MEWPHWSILFSHHPPDEVDRCVDMAGMPVCRRCLFTYSSALLALLLTSGPEPTSDSWDPVFFAMAVPATLEFVLEQLGALLYHPARVALGSVLLGIPLGRAIGRFLEDPWDPKVWAFLAVFGIPALLSVIFKAIQASRRREG